MAQSPVSKATQPQIRRVTSETAEKFAARFVHIKRRMVPNYVGHRLWLSSVLVSQYSNHKEIK
jgi:hypothetical protein